MKPQLHRIGTRLLAEPWLMTGDKHLSLISQFRAAVQERGSLRVRLQEDDDEDPHSYPQQDRLQSLAQMDVLANVEILNGVAVLRIQGILGKHLSGLDTLCGGYDLRLLEAQALALQNRADVHTVLTHWITPGGQAAGVADTARVLLDLGAQKRHIAFCEEACSGGYWLAATASQILCGESSVLGSVSAVCAMEDVSRMYEDAGISVQVFTDGDQKGAGIAGTSLSEPQRAGIQQRVEHIGGMFKTFVKARRPALTDDLLQGQWFYGDQAQQLGFADELCPTLDHAIAAAMQP